MRVFKQATFKVTSESYILTVNPHSFSALTKSSTMYAAISMGVVIILMVGALTIMIVLFIRSRLQIQRILRETKSKEKEKMQVYEEVTCNQSEIIDSLKNVAYEPPSLPQRRQT